MPFKSRKQEEWAFATHQSFAKEFARKTNQKSLPNRVNSIAPAQITNAAATAWGRYYRLAITMTGASVNNKEFLYDTVQKRWLPPYTIGTAGFSCYATIETSGELDVYAGSQSTGSVYKLNQVDYDELPSEQYLLTNASYDAPIDANPAKRAAQSFRLHSYTAQQSVPINSVFLKLKKNTGTTTGLTVRIETDNNGNPSGTLADPQATTTISSFTTTSYAYKQAIFTNVTLTGSTTYWIVVQHTTEGSGSSQYYWGGDSSSPTYSYGNTSLYVDSTSGIITYNPNSSNVSGAITNGLGASAFSTIRGSSSGTASFTNLIDVSIKAASSSNTWYDMSRAYALFDTSSLPDDAVISAATLSLYCSFVDTSITQSVGITSGTPASDSTLDNSDYAVGNFGSTRFATDKTISGLSLNAYNDFSLNANGISAISVSGTTKFGIRLSGDIDNSAPTWVTLPATATAQFTSYNSANPPRLTITYTSAGGSKIWTSDTAKDQNFRMMVQGDIDGYADTKAFFLAPQGQKAHIRYVFVTAKSASSDYNAELGINSGTFSSFDSAQFALGSSGAAWGTGKWGTMVLGGSNRSEVRIAAHGFRNRTAKFRLRNRFANQPFTIYGFRTTYEVIPKIK